MNLGSTTADADGPTFLFAFKQIVGDDPFLSSFVAPKLGTGQEEQTPVDVPEFLLAFAVGFLQYRL
jgi:hypothetical protein